jgi:hypothetical protein
MRSTTVAHSSYVPDAHGSRANASTSAASGRSSRIASAIRRYIDRRHDWAGPRAAILAATGLDIAEAPDIPQRPDFIAPRPPQAPHEPVQVTERSTEPAADPTKDYVRKERSWRERNNLPRVKRHLSPCDTTKGRRERYARKRAEQLGISFDEAMARIKVRPQTTRYGRMKAAKEGGACRRRLP